MQDETHFAMYIGGQKCKASFNRFMPINNAFCSFLSSILLFKWLVFHDPAFVFKLIKECHLPYLQLPMHDIIGD